MLNLELISPVQIAVQPVSTTARSAIVVNPEVSLYGRGEIARIVPQQTPTDAHSRRDEVPQIPLSDDVGPAMELAAIDSRRTSWNSARYVRALEVRTHQDRTRRIRRAGQEALGTPHDTDRERSANHAPRFLPCSEATGPGSKIPIFSLHEGYPWHGADRDRSPR